MSGLYSKQFGKGRARHVKNFKLLIGFICDFGNSNKTCDCKAF